MPRADGQFHVCFNKRDEQRHGTPIRFGSSRQHNRQCFQLGVMFSRDGPRLEIHGHQLIEKWFRNNVEIIFQAS